MPTSPKADSTDTPGLDGWAVPIATLFAALIAATFLTINEALKRRTEDRRQWDKEVRDLCVSAVGASNQLSEIISDIRHRCHPEPKPTMRQRLHAMRTGSDDNPLTWEQQYTMSRYPEAAKMRDRINDLKEQANLIAPPTTYAAFKALADACHTATVNLSDGVAEPSTARIVAAGRQSLIDSVKADLRIHTYFRRTKRLFDNVRVLLSGSLLFRGVVSPPR
ncbi:hypothetical protein ABQE62_05790 [Mycolicibacterium fortuitum]